jgi:peptide/nickel transport system substrate-binding protein
MPKLLLHWYWIFSSFIKKHYRNLIIGIIFGVAAFYAEPKLIRYIPLNTTIYIGRVGNYSVQALPLDIQQKISRGLTKINPDGSTSVDVAQTMSVSDDGKIFTFTLNPSVSWSNGVHLTSKDVGLSLSDVAISYPSDETITFTLTEPFSPFPIITSQPILKKITGKWPFKKTVITGLSDYQISNLVTVDLHIRSLTLKSHSQTIQYRFYPTETDAITAFKLGQIDTLEYVSTPYLKDWSNVKIQAVQASKRYLALFFNTKNSDLQDKTIRQLLSYSTPKNAQLDRVISPISRDSWAYNPQVKPYDYNLDTARSMLEKLKVSNPNLMMSFEITTIPTYADIAQNIVNSWQQIGINVKLRIVAYPDLNDYQILLIGQEIPDDPDQYALWHSTQSSNITHYQNPKIDKLLEDGRREQNQEKRKQIYQDFQRFLLEDSPAAFLYNLPLYNITRK